MSDILQSVREGRLLHLTLNRPDKRNALNAELCRALLEAIDHAARDRSVGVILITANGKSFCAGMDIGEIAEGVTSKQLDALHEQLFTLYARIEKPVVMAVHGTALGGGMGLVANAHIAICSPDATFGLTEIRLGMWPFLIYRAVSAALGERRTIELALTGRTFPADEARLVGLVHEIASNAAARALEIARSLAEISPTAVQNGLSFVHQVRGLTWEKSGEIARLVREDQFGSADFDEGVRAFLEKRQPRWPSIHMESHKVPDS
jgi:enoyl-CoA hydratase/carnithine racemase